MVTINKSKVADIINNLRDSLDEIPMTAKQREKVSYCIFDIIDEIDI